MKPTTTTKHKQHGQTSHSDRLTGLEPMGRCMGYYPATRVFGGFALMRLHLSKIKNDDKVKNDQMR